MGRGLDFVELVGAESEIAARVDLAVVFDLGAYTRNVDVVFARLSELVASRVEPIRV